MQYTTVILLVCLVLGSCSPASKLRRAEKLIKKAEEMGATWKSDTVFKEVPIILTETRVDTTIIQNPGKDIVIEKERLKVVIRRLPGDTIKVEAECKADTVYKKVPVVVNKEIKVRGKLRWYHLLLAFAIGAVVGFVLRLFRVV